MKVSTDAPLAEITLRKYPRPYELSRREVVKRLCLSMGLLQPADSRDVIVDVFQTFVDHKDHLTSEEIVKKVIINRKKHKMPLTGIAPSNIRRQIKRLRDLFLVEKKGSSYRLTEGDSLHDIFVDKIEQFYLRTITERVKEYCKELEKQ